MALMVLIQHSMACWLLCLLLLNGVQVNCWVGWGRLVQSPLCRQRRLTKWQLAGCTADVRPGGTAAGCFDPVNAMHDQSTWYCLMLTTV
jgi:hypothetical protein